MITVFTRENCSYCKRVVSCMQECIAKVEAEDPTAKLTLKIIPATGAWAALCVRLTGSLTVPHVFMQTEYIGDCVTTCSLASNPQTDCNLVMSKLRSLAHEAPPSPPFPPTPEAQMLKVTESVACSSVPTVEQLANLSNVGFHTVVDLLDPQEHCFCKEEKTILNSTHVGYVNTPLDPTNETSLRQALQVLKDAPKPVLVHCDTGVRAALVAVLYAAIELDSTRDATREQIQAWGMQIGVDLGPFAGVASRVIMSV